MIALSPAFVAQWTFIDLLQMNLFTTNYFLFSSTYFPSLLLPVPTFLRCVAAIKLKMIFFLQIFHELYQLKNWYRGLWDLQVIVFLF